ncbi:hypothetical protein LSTR_LSTR017467 [Laodelphax striatellus]|uniref:Uncharacterized protein n=1 Tax=Laodelphax striatellus TaxID=195883 RepID=A0A482WXZ2_LAOST|nr:hypothetical protein LSTR_LSTR017467 [Laodelphax striatellus]
MIPTLFVYNYYCNNQSQPPSSSSGILSNQSSVNSFESAVDSLLTQTESASSQSNLLTTPRHSVSDSLRAVYEQFGSFMKWIRNLQNGESLPYNYQR